MKNFSKYHFKDINPKEKILRVVHRSWFYLFQQFFLVILIVTVFFTGLGLIPVFSPQFIWKDQVLMLFLENFFVVSVWLYCFLIWIDYYFDIWIVTSERIINVEQKGLFTRKASELRIAKIQDVTTEVSGFLPTIFNYGDVKVQTAGEENEFLFRTVPDPYEIKGLIMKLQKQSEDHHGKNKIIK
ncbi:MAG TPA: PH domain-containing protein [Candidatus Moranbacteria bacterium]|jgi:uncharacterized membrane protein YdbT with pleckstrin-like domain|nr:PH domain-containing protein [Candidatus Moranbacteria bacterium]HOF42635.1 PH domain-containing protein [Candidatus Moranbacteria bacterium]HPX94655.1 PH domain-containing protein [Candidatus Moranbacteria bacterium]HQB59862.1 PH domain-containing protein [Candidatus Moranbacteria bacterium]